MLSFFFPPLRQENLQDIGTILWVVDKFNLVKILETHIQYPKNVTVSFASLPMIFNLFLLLSFNCIFFVWSGIWL